MKETVHGSRGSRRTEVVVRSDTEVIRIGAELSEEVQQWLCRTLRLLNCR